MNGLLDAVFAKIRRIHRIEMFLFKLMLFLLRLGFVLFKYCLNQGLKFQKHGKRLCFISLGIALNSLKFSLGSIQKF